MGLTATAGGPGELFIAGTIGGIIGVLVSGREYEVRQRVDIGSQ
jgi:hypothetical protein